MRQDVYLTNEVFLYRVVGLAGSGADEVVELEDCYGLDTVKVAAMDLNARQLRLVTPARDVMSREATDPARCGRRRSSSSWGRAHTGACYPAGYQNERP